MNVLRAAMYQRNGQDVMLIEELEDKTFRMTYDGEWLHKNTHGVVGTSDSAEPFILNREPACVSNAISEGEAYKEACHRRGIDPSDRFGFWLDAIEQNNKVGDTFLDGSGGWRIK
ncbi:hypothetical protein [Neptuniibacter sp.]|uniref:hypothetical protein n=1 Tax=Neptuniibacter sp. TaxID=1962643 RepID=UPI003B5B8FBD